jgi:hypothetical protein
MGHSSSTGSAPQRRRRGKIANLASVEYSVAYRHLEFNQRVVELYEAQSTAKHMLPVELHLIRLGDIAMATNRFEYYLDFGERIKTRSAALQTFIVQLAGKAAICRPLEV